ncbi:MAG: preprotein translocase subunit SecG [Chloroherpetonaceae bacterium]|nr:preprotein translocase subunit SecG [Chloroherpetonaceae bacterium]
MHTFVIVLTMIVSVLLVAVVLLQASKGMGLAGGLSGLGTAQVLGVRRTADVLSKTTTYLAAAFLILCIVAEFTTASTNKAKETEESVIQRNAPAAPAKPLPAPGGSLPSGLGN